MTTLNPYAALEGNDFDDPEEIAGSSPTAAAAEKAAKSKGKGMYEMLLSIHCWQLCPVTSVDVPARKPLGCSATCILLCQI